LWFNAQAEEAVNFYVSIFNNSRVRHLSRYGDARPQRLGHVGHFSAQGSAVLGLERRPRFSFTPAISFFGSCETQDEVDRLWEKLSARGRKDRCG
jgi:predicted 3-demethylubiquinone-9 3-methyltransferase (glyoxalase superfamily)